MSGGEISGNTSPSYGGGVSVSGNFTMNGGIISGNSASPIGNARGGGVYVSENFTMNGGTISGNSVGYSGGGVYASSFTMNGGTISGNSATGSNFATDSISYGGGVYAGSFAMNGGTISGNSAVGVFSAGGGVSVRGIFTMDGGTINGNSANYIGGGVYFWGTTFTMNKGAIRGNSAFDGGGVYIDAGTFAMDGGTIGENTAYYGDGVLLLPAGTLIASGKTLIDPSNAVCLYYDPETYRYSYITIGEGFDTAGSLTAIDLKGTWGVDYLEQWDMELLLLNGGVGIPQAVSSRFKPRTLFTENSVLDISGYTVKTDGRGSWIPQGSEIFSFTVNGREAEIDNTLITMLVPFDPPIYALTPEITLAEGASVYPPSDETMDFSNPVTYTVTGPGGAKKVYTVILTPMGNIPSGGLVIVDRYTPREIHLEQDGFVIRVPGTGYGAYRWYVDNSLRSITESIDLAGYDPGNYIVNVTVYKNEIPYSAEIAVTVNNSGGAG
jgi:hypothetical protein